MRFAMSLLLAVCVVTPGVARAKGKPAPVECPADVAAAIATACPCDGAPQPDTTLAPWGNHGAYVRCVVHLRNDLRKGGCLDDTLKRTLARCAARSTCGKETAVLCCRYELGTCNDPAPGDTVAAGTCSNDPALGCDVSADCTKSEGKIARDEASCAERGGVAVGSGSVCAPCPPPAP
ncbi:MAG TPA: hypothetical protein VGJ70_19500 [Solirubrobacteraceae bacterium]